MSDAITMPVDARCRHCRYSLEHLTLPRCPECGRPFDPSDPTTFWSPKGPSKRVLAVMREPSASEQTAVKVAVFLGVAAITWGEAAMAGGRLVTVLGATALLSALLCPAANRLEQRIYARRYGLGLPAYVPVSRRAVVLSVFLAVLSLLGGLRFILFESSHALLRRPFTELYTVRPAVESERLDVWFGPWHAKRPAYGSWRHSGVWHVGLGLGFVLCYEDLPNDDVELKVESDW